MGAVLYTRVSTAEQAKQQYNLPAQERKVRDFCKQQDYRVLRLFTDRGESARTADRPEFQRMMEYCRARENRGKITHVIVADLSRLARNVIDQGTTIATLKQLDITVVSVDEPITDDTAAGKLARNMLGAMNQFFSDSLSERTRYRMKAAVNLGRFPWPAPIGYLNVDKQLVIDADRAPLIRHAFELIASGNYATTDSVLSLVTAMGLRTRKGRTVTKQTWGRLLCNPIYSGWIQSGETRVRGKHEPLVSEEVFQRVQDRVNGKSRPHQKLNDDFPLRGFVKCAGCGKNLTAGWARGRKERYARYWCWTKGCGAVGVSRDDLEGRFIGLLGQMEASAEFLAQLPVIATREWETRKIRIGKDAEMLSKRLADQETLNRKAIQAKINGEISPEDFKLMKDSISAESERIKEQISALDSERSDMQTLMAQAQVQAFDFVKAWKDATINQKQEMAKGLFDGSLLYSDEMGFFEPRNQVIIDMQIRWLREHEHEGRPIFDVGVPDGI